MEQNQFGFLYDEDFDILKNSKILVVDDMRFLRNYIQKIFEKFSSRVETAADGYEAINKAQSFKPDVILLDIVMKNINGFETAKKLKRMQEFKNTPIIFLTSQSDKNSIIKGFMSGGVDYIIKPFNDGELIMRTLTHLKLSQKNRRLEKAIESAARIQMALLPKKPLITDTLESAFLFKPALTAAGDIFNIFRLDENHIGFYVGDVESKGIEAAMMAVSIFSSLHTQNLEYSLTKRITPDGYKISSPAEVLHKLNKEFSYDRFKKSFAIGYGIVNVQNGHLKWSKSLLPNPVLITDKKVYLLGLKNIPIGFFENPKFNEVSMKLKPGNVFMFYSDGLIEQTNNKKEIFGFERLIKVLSAYKYPSLQMLIESLKNEVEKFSENRKQYDDITLLAIKYRGQS